MVLEKEAEEAGNPAPESLPPLEIPTFTILDNDYWGDAFAYSDTSDSTSNFAFGYGGNDTFEQNNSQPYTAFGGAGDNTITGGEADDFLVGGIGRDVISGGLGADRLYSEDGGDIISVGPDTLTPADYVYISDTSRYGWTTITADFWAADDADANNKLYVGNRSGYKGCYTTISETRLRTYFDGSEGCERGDFDVEVDQYNLSYRLRGATGNICRVGRLICPK